MQNAGILKSENFLLLTLPSGRARRAASAGCPVQTCAGRTFSLILPVHRAETKKVDNGADIRPVRQIA